MPGALGLGLLASLFTHAVLFGNGHAVGGALHEALIQGAVAVASALALAWGALAWDARRLADGTVLGARLTSHLPGWPAVAGCAAGWYFLIEHSEAPHAGAGLGIVLAALVACAALICKVAQFLVRSIAAVVVAIARTRFSPRAVFAPPAYRRVVRPATPALRRRYARPPPIASLCA
jgi:hypothetical protein